MTNKWRMKKMSAYISCVTLPSAPMQSWEARFKSQAQLDEVAVLACMAYVDLNRIRAARELQNCRRSVISLPFKREFRSLQIVEWGALD